MRILYPQITINILKNLIISNEHLLGGLLLTSSKEWFFTEETGKQVEDLLKQQISEFINDEDRVRIKKHCRKVLDALYQLEKGVTPYKIEEMRLRGWNDGEIDSALTIATYLVRPSFKHELEITRDYLIKTSSKKDFDQQGRVWDMIIKELKTNLAQLDTESQFFEIFISLTLIFEDQELALEVGSVLSKIISQTAYDLMYT